MPEEDFTIDVLGQEFSVIGDFSPGRPQTLNEPEEYPEFTVTELKLDGAICDLDQTPEDLIDEITVRFLDGEFYDDDQER